jgi:hypothetical protein
VRVVAAASLALRFVLCDLAALAYAGFQARGVAGWLLAVLLPGAAAALRRAPVPGPAFAPS